MVLKEPVVEFGNLDVLASYDFHCYLANQHTPPRISSRKETKQNQSIRELGRKKQNQRAHALKKSCLMRLSLSLKAPMNQTVTTTKHNKVSTRMNLLEAKSLRI